ncbi:MAG: hypothetical protein Ta2A_08500 [Treponemataceae bacterium]|nr:MAG: hypothetical protein Ta2A_08500 [Treponemataceae bacterium]
MTDTILKCKGMETLTQALGMVEAERFIALILREPFDYTIWQRDLYKDMSLNEFHQNVKKFRAKNQE